MPSNRRVRVLGLLVVLAVVVVLYITSAARQSQQNPFYIKTADALAAQRAAKEAALGSKDHVGASSNGGSDGGVAARLKEAENAAKLAADKKAEDYHGEQVVDNKRKEAQVLKEKAKEEAEKVKEKAKEGVEKVKEGVDKVKEGAADKVKEYIGSDDRKEAVLQGEKEKSAKEAKEASAEAEKDRDIKEELNSILKRSPIIIFSKSYCPYSRKAKDILLSKYSITPPPYIVELDEHPLGSLLQAELGSSTGRRTVPNILINGKSIGGGDDIERLHRDGKLIDTIKNMGGKRMEVSAKG